MSVVKTKIFAEHIAELGEGPGYDPLTGNVWWFDILGQRLIEKNWDSGETHVHELGMKASALAVIDRNRQLIVSEHGLFIRERANGRLTLHHPLEADNEITRSNDARVHPSGAFWIGTMGKKAEKEAGSIWWYREGHVKKLFSGITITNSICFSPDGKVAYFADTDRNII
ncbi:SMP-30/gluconolactonase/LRE family protein, partial [Brucella suis]